MGIVVFKKTGDKDTQLRVQQHLIYSIKKSDIHCLSQR